MAVYLLPSSPPPVLDFLHPSLFDMNLSSADLLSILPPEYSPSADAPVYSPEPGPSEQRLALTSRPRTTPRGILRRTHAGITVALRDQDENAHCPTYGRRGFVLGDIELSNSQSVTSVTATLEGRLDLTLGETAETRWTFLSSSYTLWKADGTSLCPSVLPLECMFPETYLEPNDGHTRPLPPTYDPIAAGMRDLRVRIGYKLVIRVTKEKVAGLLWKPHKNLSIPLNYIPRARPHRPILSSSFPFLATLKSMPEEWHHINAQMPSTSPSFDGIDCNLFIPDVQIYGKDDTIPFFLQLRAPTATMRELYRPSAPVSSKSLRPRSWLGAADSVEPKIRVYIRRQVVGMAHGERLARSYVISEGELRPVPPGSTPAGRAQDDELSVDYEGELKLSSTVTVGGFNAGRLSVLDYVVLSIVPPAPLFEEVNHPHGIRIVTDSCSLE